jgi:DNA replication protein DnaC
MMTDGAKNEFMMQVEPVYEMMKMHGMKLPVERVKIIIPGAAKILENCFRYFLSLQEVGFEWLPEYGEIAAWLENSRGLGLFLHGSCGRGKSMLARYVIPAILLKYCAKKMTCYDSREMNRLTDEVLSKRLISLDEIGVENVSVDYGNRRDAFFEVMDSVEKEGKLVVVSTNLSGEEVLRRYGERVFERIVATTKQVEFKGGSLRK